VASLLFSVDGTELSSVDQPSSAMTNWNCCHYRGPLRGDPRRFQQIVAALRKNRKLACPKIVPCLPTTP